MFFSWSSNGTHIASFEIMTCISSYTHLITPATKYKNVFWYSGKIRFIEPQGIKKWAQETCAGCPQQRYIPGEPGNVQGQDRVGIVEGSCGYRAREYWGKIRFIEKPGVQDEGGRHVAKRSSVPRVAYPEVNVQVRDLVRVSGIVAPFAPRGFSIRRKFVLSIGQAKSSIPALSYFQVGGMKPDQELYAKVSYITSTCEGSSM